MTYVSLILQLSTLYKAIFQSYTRHESTYRQVPTSYNGAEQPNCFKLLCLISTAPPAYQKVSQIVTDQISLRLRSNRADATSSLANGVLLFKLGLTSANEFIPVDFFHHAPEGQEQNFRLSQCGFEIDLRKGRRQWNVSMA